MIIEIIKGAEKPESRKFKNSDDLSWSQKGFAHMGGVFPVEIKIPIENASYCNPVGKYHLNPSSFKVGQYGDLEINKWNIELIPVNSNASAPS
jgi:hypothetical protein